MRKLEKLLMPRPGSSAGAVEYFSSERLLYCCYEILIAGDRRVRERKKVKSRGNSHIFRDSCHTALSMAERGVYPIDG